ncbi:hypothetical protein Leryth_012195 [Lithospermum erythrorhizon]|nr:hypothetical protein Leryth_012195 [Lithospermum erythrorhizon]
MRFIIIRLHSPQLLLPLKIIPIKVDSRESLNLQEQIGVMMKISTPRNFFSATETERGGFYSPTSHVMSTMEASKRMD